MLIGIDYFVVTAYLASIILQGYYFRKFESSSDDFLLGGCEALVTKVHALGTKYQNHFK